MPNGVSASAVWQGLAQFFDSFFDSEWSFIVTGAVLVLVAAIAAVAQQL